MAEESAFEGLPTEPVRSPLAPETDGNHVVPTTPARPVEKSLDETAIPVAEGLEPVAEAVPEPDDDPADDDPAGESVLSTEELFLRVNSVIPDSQAIVTIEPGRSCFEAFEIMKEMGFSQIPIVKGRQVIGIFSFRSFALAVAGTSQGKSGDLPVEDAMEDPVWVRASDELDPLTDVFDARDAVLVGDEANLQAIVTGMDVLRKLNAISRPFVRLRGIELALRLLIEAAAREGKLAEIATAALAKEFAERPGEPPTRTVDMTLGQLIAVVLRPQSWVDMKTSFGANRGNAVTHLTGLPKMRNDALHFRRTLDEDELSKIKTTSDWLRTRMRATGLGEAHQ